jgi:PIN domain nuclease of toxin-antitoxin system
MNKQNLLDTHTIIWFIDGSKEISRVARQEIESENAANFVSIASLWEMAIKISLGKLELKTPFNQINIKLAENGFAILPVTFEDTLIVSALPFHHRDPFDRLIIAQSMTNKLSVISKDDLFSYYSIKVIW